MGLWVYGATPPSTLRDKVISWAAGDMRPIGGTRYPTAGWHLPAPLPATAALEDRIVSILEALSPATREIAARPASVRAEIACSIHLQQGEQTPPLFLSSMTIETIASLHLDLDIDMFVDVTE